MPTEEEIRALCLLVLQARCNDEFDESLRTLRAALSEHFLAAENLGIHMLLNMPKQMAVTFAKGKDEKEPKE